MQPFWEWMQPVQVRLRLFRDGLPSTRWPLQSPSDENWSTRDWGCCTINLPETLGSFCFINNHEGSYTKVCQNSSSFSFLFFKFICLFLCSHSVRVHIHASNCQNYFSVIHCSHIHTYQEHEWLPANTEPSVCTAMHTAITVDASHMFYRCQGLPAKLSQWCSIPVMLHSLPNNTKAFLTRDSGSPSIVVKFGVGVLSQSNLI